jgi:hypothetical protein
MLQNNIYLLERQMRDEVAERVAQAEEHRQAHHSYQVWPVALLLLGDAWSRLYGQPRRPAVLHRHAPPMHA